MLYCCNTSCSNPFNPDDNKFCIKCGQTLTPLLRNRFIESLQEQYDLLSQKLSRLRLDLVIESGAVVKFQLEKQIENAEAERTQLTQRIEQLENSL
ncbi:4-Cys prefix domain-containing protein [Nostoc sp.]|uniref:4-Cys prefix domain-containing protein n=1 Tax=Nostoc sp. TaxID=1180 RepID=UPI002FFCBB0C